MAMDEQKLLTGVDGSGAVTNTKVMCTELKTAAQLHALCREARLEGAEAMRDSLRCDDCGGDGSLGRCHDGREQSCEKCGGHEDALGSGLGVDSYSEIEDPAAVVAKMEEPESEASNG